MQAKRAVLVTGASTGIGRKITERLSHEGYHVYAGARRDSDMEVLGSLENVQPLRMDVTRPPDIAAALDIVATNRYPLCGLVNNAGVATLGPVVNGNDTEFDLVMSVNVHGAFRVTKAFASLIAAQRGRIVMIGSISGILANNNVCTYSMSKHAIEAFTDSLAAELAPLGVAVSVIEPSNRNTRIAKNAIDRVSNGITYPDLSRCSDPDDVASAVLLALFDPSPKRRYLVVSSQDEARLVLQKQIEQLVQLNERHRYSYDNDALVRMLVEQLERSLA